MSSTWDTVRDGVEKILPFAVGVVNPALGGILATALGTKNDPDSVSAALQSDPNAAEKLLAYKAQIQTAVIAEAVATLQSDAADRASARQLSIAKNFTPQVTLSALFVGGYFTLLVMFILGYTKVDPAYKDLLLTLIGVLTAGIPQILNFWFGSSHGSQKKDDALAQAALSD